MDLRTGGIVLGHFEVVYGIYGILTSLAAWIMILIHISAAKGTTTYRKEADQDLYNRPEIRFFVAGTYFFQ